MTNKINSIKLLTLLLLSTVICAELFASEVNVYSGRKEKLIKPLLDEFSKETGVQVNLVTAKSSALLKRLELEAQSSPADIFITVDVGRLHHAKKIGLFQKIDKESLVNVKEAYLDKEGYWVGLSKRVRTIVVDKKITESEIKSFKDLTSGKFQNEICIRSSNNIYNQSMVASFIYHFGEKKTEKLMKKFVNNFARKPSGNDRAQIYSILKGECSIAVVRENKLTSGYIRPMCFYGAEGMGLRADGLKEHLIVAAWEWGSYFSKENLQKGIRVKTSSYNKHFVNSSMCKAKANGNYINSMLALQEALNGGYDEALLLDTNGFVAEGSGENIFIVTEGKIVTPELTSALDGITRRSVIEFAHDLGIEIITKPITKDEIYIAEEAFFTGTAAEVTPIRELDDKTIGNGEMGNITKELQKLYFKVVNGEEKKYNKWLKPIK